MIIKHREKPKELKVAEALRGRKIFTEEEEYNFWNSKTGFKGETDLDKIATEEADDKIPFVHDLLLAEGGAYQIDSLAVTDHAIYLLDCKNYTGPLTYQDGNFYVNGQKMRRNPLNQLERAVDLLDYVLRKNGIKIRIIPQLVFINPNMIFYGNEPDLPILTYGEIGNFLKSIPPPTSNRAVRIAQFLASLHTSDNPYENIMKYSYDEIKKGILCTTCRMHVAELHCRGLVCKQCGMKESKTEGLNRSIDEFRILFPDKPLKVDAIYKWCGKTITKRTIHTLFKK